MLEFNIFNNALSNYATILRTFQSSLVLIQIEKTDLVSMCKVLDDDALNVSTHRPIVMRFELPHVEQIGSKASLRHRVKCCIYDKIFFW